MSSLNSIMDATVRKYAETIACGRPIPDYLQKQVAGIYETETDFVRGLATLQEGIEMEGECLEEIWKKSFLTAK